MWTDATRPIVEKDAKENRMEEDEYHELELEQSENVNEIENDGHHSPQQPVFH